MMTYGLSTLISLDEAATLLGWSPNTVEHRARLGEIRRVLQSGGYRYDVGDWLRLRGHETDSNQETISDTSLCASAGPLVAPFPWFGGKRTVAAIVWDRFGDAVNYIEPFAGSLAVLLARPHPPKTETVNDKDGMIVNFWRAVRAAPKEVADYADWPVSEADLSARHYWLVTEGAERLGKILDRPDAYDAQVAGWWLWGICSWIGGGWCSGKGPWVLEDSGTFVKKSRGSAGVGISKKLPHLDVHGRGIFRKTTARRQFIENWMMSLSHRLRDVRIAYGDWSRVTASAVMRNRVTTAVFLDPPYTGVSYVYSEAKNTVACDCRKWAIENGDNPRLRIALCGYEGEHEMPDTWRCQAWKAGGGYGNHSQGKGRDNATRERIWFSPHRLK